MLFLKLTGYNLELIKSAASISWIKLISVAPDFATNIYLVARFSSCLLGVFSVYMVYRIGRLVFSRAAGLLAAAMLSVSMGFISVNHFVKYDALLHLLMLVSAYFCIKAIQSRDFKKNIFLASLFAGFSAATKYNGGIMIIPLILAYLIKNKRVTGSLLGISGIYILGVLIAWPGIILSFHKYLTQASYFKVFIVGTPMAQGRSYPVSLINYFLQILIMFGLPVSIFVFYGLMRDFLKIKRIPPGALILLSTIIPYYLIVSSFKHLPHADNRYIIAIIPFLSVFGGKALSDFLNCRLGRLLKYSLISVVFIFTFLYALQADLLFVKNDTRYQSTEWVLKNIPKGSTIEMFKQIDWLVAADRIVPHYKLVFYGLSSDKSGEESQFKLYLDKVLRREYFKRLNTQGPESEFIMLIFENLSDIPYGLRAPSGNDELQFIYSLVNGRQPYTLIKQFSHPNDKLKSKYVKGLSYPRSILWNPNPTCYTSPVILIFKKI